MNDPVAIANAYIAAWNETDAAARRAKLSAGWAEGARYADPVTRAEGLNAIDAMIDGGVQTRFPTFRFALAGEPTGHNEFVRFRWAFAPRRRRGADRGRRRPRDRGRPDRPGNRLPRQAAAVGHRRVSRPFHSDRPGGFFTRARSFASTAVCTV